LLLAVRVNSIARSKGDQEQKNHSVPFEMVIGRVACPSDYSFLTPVQEGRPAGHLYPPPRLALKKERKWRAR